jgi:phage shock protein C
LSHSLVTKLQNMNQTLNRVGNDRILGGVCGGIAKYLGWDPSIVRLLYVLVSIFSAAFPGIIVYIILWIVMPEE